MGKLTTIKTAGLSREEWLEQRTMLSNSGRTGGSDQGALAGINPYKGPVSMFYQAVGLAERGFVNNEATFHGTLLEDYVAGLYDYWSDDQDEFFSNYENGVKTRKHQKRNAIIINEDYPWLFANLDGVITSHPEYDGKGILEIKTISSYASDKWVGGIPPYYMFQIQCYMLVLGYEYAELAMLKDGRNFEVFSFEPNESIQNTILEQSKDFYERVQAARKLLDAAPHATYHQKMNLVSKLEPPNDGSMDASAFYSEVQKAKLEEITIEADSDLIETVLAYHVAHKEEKLALESKRRYANEIKKQMVQRDATRIDCGDLGRVLFRKNFSVKLNEDELKKYI